MTPISARLALVVIAGVLCSADVAQARRLVGRRFSGSASWHQRTSRPVTAARGLRRGTKLWVWRPGHSSRRGLAVWVNDSGPYTKGRVLDLSTGAFKHLFGSLRRGHGPVRYKVLRLGPKKRKRR